MSNDQQKYTDVGMILPGAPKFRAKAMVASLDFTSLIENVADSLGIPVESVENVRYDQRDDRDHHLLEEWQAGLAKDKLWPSPPYAEMIEQGVPAQAVCFIKKLRDLLPRHAHRPSPETLATFSEAVLQARQFADIYLDHWRNAAKTLTEAEPSYGRVVQIAALISDLSATAANISRVSPAYPIPIAPPLSKESYEAILEGFRATPPHEEAFNQLQEALVAYKQADRRQGTSYYNTRTCVAFKGMQAARSSLDDLRNLMYSTQPSSYEAMSDFRPFLRYRLKPNMAGPLTDRRIGYELPILAQLKLKPQALPAPAYNDAPEALVTTPADTPTTSKPRRPERLSASDAETLLAMPEDEAEAEKYQDLNVLVDMGMVRGIQWGEWVPQKERVALVKNIFESFQNFATGMRITPSLVGLGSPISEQQREQLRADGLFESNFTGNESLGLALGARGKSAAAAHYEPGLHTINLTRLKGAGALAHEIFHGLDYKLTQLIDLSKINNHYGGTDVRKTTASKKGITTFSEMIAHHWWMRTYLTDRGQELLINPTNFATENKRHILKYLRQDISSNEALREKVLPLMVGVAEFIREMYHREREPEEMLENAIHDTSRAVNVRLFGAAAESVLTPSPYGKINKGYEAIFQAYLTLANPGDEWHESDAAQLRKLLTQEYLTEKAEIEPDLKNWRNYDVVDFLESTAYRISYNATLRLENLLGRDIGDSHKETIRRFIEDSVELAGLQALIFEAAAKQVRDLDCPPTPLHDTDPAKTQRKNDVREQIAVAIGTTLKVAPLDLLARFTRLSRACASSSGIVETMLKALPPTASGALAGLTPVDVSRDPRASLWTAGLGGLIGATRPESLAPKAEAVDVLRTICDARRTPPLRELLAPSSHLLEALSHAKACLVSALQSDDYLNDFHFLDTLKTLRKASPDCTLHELMTQLAQEPLESNDIAPMSRWDRQKLAVALVASAYRNSPLYDGTLVTYLDVMRNPTLLGENAPKCLPTLYAYMHAHDQGAAQASEVDDWASPDAQATFARELVKAGNALVFPLGSIRRGRELSTDVLNQIHDRRIDKVLTNIITRAIKNDDMTGLQAFEALERDVGISFRYLSAEERRDHLSTCYGLEAPKIRELLSEEKFLEHYRAVKEEALEIDTLQEAAGCVIQASQHLTGELRRLRTTPNFVASLESAKKGLNNLKISQRAASETLLHSAAYDEVQLAPTPFWIAPGNKKGYWYSAKEMFARCSEAALHDILEAQGIHSPYLVTVPSPASQAKAAAGLQGVYPGESVQLNYPAGDERTRFAKSMSENVIPHMEEALSALFPDAKAAYDRYSERLTALEARDAMIQRMDQETDERMLPQGQSAEAETTSHPEDNVQITPQAQAEHDPAGSELPALAGEDQTQPTLF